MCIVLLCVSWPPGAGTCLFSVEGAEWVFPWVCLAEVPSFYQRGRRVRGKATLDIMERVWWLVLC